MSVSQYDAAYVAKTELRSRLKKFHVMKSTKNYGARYQKAQAIATSFTKKVLHINVYLSQESPLKNNVLKKHTVVQGSLVWSCSVFFYPRAVTQRKLAILVTYQCSPNAVVIYVSVIFNET